VTDSDISRRQWLGGAALLAAAPMLARANEAARPEARVAQGALRGTWEADGIALFRGIPFAAPPVGALRFRPPAPPAAWSDVRDASAFGPAPVQPAPPPGISHRDFLGADISEDCLYLNVWRPATRGPHPVLVWIHGGGNMAGAASQGVNGMAFARAGIVCVTIGYRVGAFGFLELGALLGASYRGSGVNGLRDQIAALRWVRDNIHAFGGDAGRVTISGGSAGGKNVVALMASPPARGLFASAIVESGGQTIHDLCSADAVAALFAERLRADGMDAGALVTLAADRINALQVEAMAAYPRPFLFRAITGTDVVPEAPIAALHRNPAPQRLLIGTNRDEGIMSVDRTKADAPVAQRELSNVEVESAAAVAARYDRRFARLDALHRRVRFLSAAEYVFPSLQVADAVRGRAETWVYRFEQPAPSGPFAGWAVHGSEALYAWKLFDDPLLAATFGKAGAEGPALGDDMNARWAAFVHGRAPDVDGLPRWPAYDGKRLLRFADGGSAPGTVDRAEMALWKGVAFGGPGGGGCE